MPCRSAFSRSRAASLRVILPPATTKCMWVRAGENVRASSPGWPALIASARFCASSSRLKVYSTTRHTAGSPGLGIAGLAAAAIRASGCVSPRDVVALPSGDRVLVGHAVEPDPAPDPRLAAMTAGLLGAVASTERFVRPAQSSKTANTRTTAAYTQVREVWNERWAGANERRLS